jgi:hypothetical protein
MAISVQVDDVCLTGTFATSAEAVRTMIPVADGLAELLEDKLRLPVARDKTVVAASTKTLSDAVARGLRRWGAQSQEAPRRLGLRFALRKTSDRSLARARLGSLFRKSRRLRILAKVKGSGRQPGRCFVAFATGALYGTEVLALPVADLRKIRVEAAKLSGLFVRGGAPELYWALQGGADPWASHWSGIWERYHREWWYAAASRQLGEVRPSDALTMPEMVAAFAAATARHEEAARAAAAGIRKTRMPALPLDGVLAAARLADWQFLNASTCRSRDGDIIELMHGSPALVKRRLTLDLQAAQQTGPSARSWRRLVSRTGGASTWPHLVPCTAAAASLKLRGA